MPDDKTKRGGSDRTHINVHEDYELRYWTDALDVTPEELKDVIAKVGTSVEMVRLELWRREATGAAGNE